MRHHEFLSEDELFEIKMSPANLQKLAGAIPDAKFGLEFELIVPNVDADDADEPGEADYDEDERCRGIEEIVDFFCNSGVGGEYNSERVLRTNLESSYYEWVDDEISRRWDRDSYEYTRDWVENNTSVREEAEDSYREDNPDADYDDVREAGDLAVESAAEDDSNRDNAYDEFADEVRSENLESDWLDDEGYRYMSDIENNFGETYWPYRQENNDTDMDQVAASIGYALGVEVKVGGYHGVNRNDQESEGFWILETDSSLDASERNQAGLELVSPPLKLDAMKKAVGLVAEWAESVGAYTGKHNKTGLHMNVSVPGYSQDKLDFVKLALLLGDNHILKEFDRMSYSYAKSSFDLLATKLKNNPAVATQALDKMKEHFNLAASRAVHSGQTDKYTSINVKDNRVEFRGPGGDYLQMFAKNPDKLFAPMMRFAVALDAAITPTAYRNEYQKKLYKFLGNAVKDKGDLLSLFTDYAAGKGFPQSAYKSFLKQRKADRDFDREIKRQQQELEKSGEGIRVGGRKSNPDGQWILFRQHRRENDYVKPYDVEVLYRFNAASKEDVDIVRDQYVKEHNPSFQVLMASDPEKKDGQPGEYKSGKDKKTKYELYSVATGRAVEHNGEPIQFDAVDQDDAESKIDRYVADFNLPAASYSVRSVLNVPQHTTTTQARAADGSPQATAPNGVPMWTIYRISDGEVVHNFAEHPSQHSRTALSWLRDQGFENPQITFRVRAMSQNEQDQSAVPGSTIDLQRQRAQQSAVNTPPEGGTGEGLHGNWGFWMRNAARFAAWPGASNDNLRRFSSREAAQQWLDGAREQNPRMRTDIEIREIEPEREPVSNINLFPEINPPATQARGGFTGIWKVIDNNGQELHRFYGIGNNQADANRVAARWVQDNTPRGSNTTEFSVIPVMGNQQ